MHVAGRISKDIVNLKKRCGLKALRILSENA